MHIGVTDFGASTWTGGSTLARMIARVLGAGTEVRCSLLSDSSDIPSYPGVRPLLLKKFYRHCGRLESFLRSAIRRPPRAPLDAAIRREGIDVILPLVNFQTFPSCATVGWIPDFQHAVAPQFFSEEEVRLRTLRCRQVAEKANRVLFSSEDAARTYRRLLPEFAAKARATPFPSSLALDPLPEMLDVGRTFILPDKFAVVPNQFWRHKNHLGVLRALSILKSRNLKIPCVFTGLLYDSRDPGGTHLSSLLQAMVRENVKDCLFFLGFVSRPELVSLMRRAALVIQPSFCEGWSTSVQDAKALGRPVLCSDIPVLREQAPQALGFFPPDDPEAMAESLSAVWNQLAPGPDFPAEQSALEKERLFLDTYRDALLQLCREACQAHS